MMQITVQLLGDEIALPIAVNETIQGLIYKGISEDPDYSSHIHEEGQRFGSKKYKLFTFGEPQGRYKICDKTIVYLGEMWVTVRSVDPYLIQLLFSYFKSNKTVRLGEHTVTVGNVTLTDDRIFDDRIVVRTLSPITAYVTDSEGHTVYFSPDDSRFYESIIANAERKWRSVNGDEKPFSLEIAPVDGARFVKRATRFKHTFITAWHGTFTLVGAPAVLDFLYRTGLGSKNSQGFGMFEQKKQ